VPGGEREYEMRGASQNSVATASSVGAATARVQRRYIAIAFWAALGGNVVFAIQRLLSELANGLLTGWWVNVAGALGILAIYGYYRGAPQRRFAVVLSAGVAICATVLILPVCYGMVSSPWWLVLLPLGAVLLGGLRIGVVWAGICAVALATTHIAQDALLVPGSAGETLLESTMSRVVLLALLFIIAWQARVASTKQATELEAVGARLHASNVELERSGKAKSAFLAHMSHEIRNPLNGVLGMHQLTLDGVLSRDARAQIELAQQSASSLLEVVNQSLDLAKIEAGHLDVEVAPMVLRDAVLQALRPFAPQARERGLYLRILVEPAVANARMGDSVRIKQILVNLVGNAIKFTATGGVTVRLGGMPGAPEQVVMTVADTGIGISEAAQARIFEPFVQADASTTRRFGGTGLGLSISRLLARLLGGDVTVESRVGVGTTFVATVDAPVPPGASWSSPALTGRQVWVVGSCEESASSLFRTVTHLGASARRVTSVAEAAALGELPAGATVVLDADPGAGDEVGELAAWASRQPHARVVAVVPPGGRWEARSRAAAVVEMPAFADVLAGALAAADEASADVAARGGDEAVARPGDATPSARPLRVLLVEDDPTNQLVASKLLERLGHAVEIAPDGEAALESFDQAGGGFDLVVTDLEMPRLDGAELVRRLRERPATPPILLLTAQDDVLASGLVTRTGADGCLSKPVSLTSLSEALAALAVPGGADPLESDRPRRLARTAAVG